MIEGHQHVLHLVTPLEHVLVPVLDCVVDVQELEDAVPPHVVGVALGLFPAQWRALGQQPHGRVLLPAAAPLWGRPRAARRASRPFPLRLGPRRAVDSPGRGLSPPPGLALPRRPCGPGRRGSAPLGAAGVVHGLPTCDPKLRRHRLFSSRLSGSTWCYPLSLLLGSSPLMASWWSDTLLSDLIQFQVYHRHG